MNVCRRFNLQLYRSLIRFCSSTGAIAYFLPTPKHHVSRSLTVWKFEIVIRFAIWSQFTRQMESLTMITLRSFFASVKLGCKQMTMLIMQLHFRGRNFVSYWFNVCSLMMSILLASNYNFSFSTSDFKTNKNKF